MFQLERWIDCRGSPACIVYKYDDPTKRGARAGIFGGILSPKPH